jgi:phytoene dehydrogenase-like protein
VGGRAKTVPRHPFCCPPFARKYSPSPFLRRKRKRRLSLQSFVTPSPNILSIAILSVAAAWGSLIFLRDLNAPRPPRRREKPSMVLRPLQRALRRVLTYHHHRPYACPYASLSLPLARSAGTPPPSQNVDALIVGAGHNGLAAAFLLAKQGLVVRVVEASDVAGGACRTEHPFPRMPGLGQSSGAYLLGVMPPELYRLYGLAEAGVVPLRRDPHYFLPTPTPTKGSTMSSSSSSSSSRSGSGGSSTTQQARSLLFGADPAANRQQFHAFFGPQQGEAEWQADQRMQQELAQLREDLAPAWLRPPPALPSSASAEDVARTVAERYVRPQLRAAFVGLMTRPALHYVERFGSQSELMKAMMVVTDGLSGLAGGIDDASTGPNFMAHNMCRLPGAGGTWMVVQGGMGSVTRALARRAAEAGARLTTGSRVASIDFDRPSSGGSSGTSKAVVTGVTLESGECVRAKAVVVNADPFTLRRLVDGGVSSSSGSNSGSSSSNAKNTPSTTTTTTSRFSPQFNARLDALERGGFTAKVNLALRRLPTFTCLPDPSSGQHRTTAHLLPGVGDGLSREGGCRVLDALREGHSAAVRGEVDPENTAIEVYFHTTVDRSLSRRAPHGSHSAALFVQHIPYERADGQAWDGAAEKKLADDLLRACDAFAPDFSSCVADTFTLSPKGIERHFGIHRGHIHHVDNGAFFSQRFPYRVPGVDGLFSASAGTHPAGSVIGCGGHNAAGVVARALGVEPWWPTAGEEEEDDDDGTCGWE